MAIGAFRDIVENTEEQRRTFFKLAFGPDATGWLCIAFKEHANNKMQQMWFSYPDQLEDMLLAIEDNSHRLVHFWFSTAVFKEKGDRHKSNIKYSTVIHCDLDKCDPRLLLVEPSILVQSSPGRFQAMWVLEQPIPAVEAEYVNTRIAYYHRDQGADTCHDAGHLLRIPYTPNYKYGDLDTAPVVSVLHARRLLYRISDFAVYPTIKSHKFLDQQGQLPDLPDEDAQQIIARYGNILQDPFYEAYNSEPNDDTAPESKWSGALWHLMRCCLEAGMSRIETFVIAASSKCNKFARDGRSEVDLWNDVLRTYLKHIEHTQVAPTTTSEIPELLTEEETKQVQRQETFVERYISWAKGQTDAPVQYHEAGAFMILSALLCGNISLETSHETYHPNLWFMILAGTTLTRKSTTQRLALNLLRDVDERAEMATDGSIEGILSGLRDRPGQPSIFLKDEFTGLLEQIAHKDYMSGFAEQLTKLYDGDSIKRLLRKETIEVRDPRFIIYAAGIKDKTQSLLTEEHVMSGFIPRFVFISGESHPENIKLTEPPKPDESHEARELLKNELVDLFNHYVQPHPVIKDGKIIGSMPADFQALLTPEAWHRYNVYERQMMDTAISTGLTYLMPVYVRLTVSTIKAALLLAASRKRAADLVVEEIDILHAIYYAQRWRVYASEVIGGIGKTYDERLIDRIYGYICSSDTGVARSELMNVFKLDMKRADLIFGTMVQRNLVFVFEVAGQRRYRATSSVGKE